ncbi:MAG: GntR family transcriptional regulator [Salinarimonas sp.]
MAMNVNTIGARRATLAAEVRAELERMIVAGELAAGEKLNEAVLANAMGVSRGTVREAIRSLADSGLIDLIANRGAFVHQTTLDEVHNLYELRGAIFAMACAAAARRVHEGDERELVERLRHNLETMEGVRDRDDREAYYALNIAFHDMLLQAARNPKAKTMYDNLVREMHLFRRRGLSIATNIEQSLAEHGAIFAAVEAGDPEGAQRAAQAHIVAGFVRYTGMIEDHKSVERAGGT